MAIISQSTHNTTANNNAIVLRTKLNEELPIPYSNVYGNLQIWALGLTMNSQPL